MTQRDLQEAVSCRGTTHAVYNLDSWIEENFDFEEWLRISRATKPPTSNVPRAYGKHPEVLKLEAASAAGDLNAVQEILQRWEDMPDNERCYKDHFASSFDLTIRGDHISIASCLVDNGVELDWAHFERAMEFKYYPFLELCLDQGFDLNEARSRVDPPRLADTLKDEKLMQWFLDHGANPIAGCEMDVTPLSKALQFAPFHVILLFFHIGGPTSFQHGQLLHHAVLRNLPDRLRVVDFVLMNGALPTLNNLKYHDQPRLANEENWVIGAKTPVHYAAMTGKLDVVKYLIMRGANPTIPDGKGRRAIDEAQSAGFSDVVEYLSSLSARAVL
ncbi:MAG: hypothetical protein Q9163_003027 [Psora crenata]